MADVSEEGEGIIISGRAFRKLLESPHWTAYTEALERMIEFRLHRLGQPAKDVGDVLTSEFEKGTIEGMRLCLSMPSATVEEMERLQAIKYDEDKINAE